MAVVVAAVCVLSISAINHCVCWRAERMLLQR